MRRSRFTRPIHLSALALAGLACLGVRAQAGHGDPAVDLDASDHVETASNDDVLKELRRLRERVDELETWKADREARDAELAASHSALQSEVAAYLSGEEGGVAPLGIVRAPRVRSLRFGGQIRVRGEMQRRSYTPADVDGNDTNDVILGRVRLNARMDVSKDLSAFVEIQDARVWGTEASTAANSDNVDLSEGWVNFDNILDEKLEAKVGRQKVAISDQRFIGHLEWANNGRRFDGVTAQWRGDGVHATGFAYRLAEGFIEPSGTFGPLVEGGDTDTNLWGAFVFFPKLVGDTDAEVFGIYLDSGTPLLQEPKAPATTTIARNNTQFLTYGARVHGQEEDGGFDWDFTGAAQVGELRGDDLSAYAARGEIGYTLADARWKPRFHVEYDWASGEKKTDDGKHEQFQVLFPTNHGYYGIHDYQAWSNMNAWSVGVSMQPAENVKLALAYWNFELDETAGGWVLASGSQLRPGANSGLGDGLGDEVDLVLTYKAGANVTWQVGWAHFMAGEFVRDTQGPEGTAPDTDFAYVQMLLVF